MTTEELKQLADLSDQVIKLKQLIHEMELRVVSFENNRDLNKVINPLYFYWDGKRSEASFITEKLLNIFAENEADESQPSCLGAVSRRLFLVTFLGKDERGEIVKGIEVMADSSEDAMNLIKEISMSREIYSAIDV